MKPHYLVGMALLASSASAADQFTFVSGGQAKSQIVTGPQAPETVRFAAKELRTFVAKMSGAELPIVAQAVAGVPAIRLGPAARGAVCHDIVHFSARVLATVVALLSATLHPGGFQRWLGRERFSSSHQFPVSPPDASRGRAV